MLNTYIYRCHIKLTITIKSINVLETQTLNDKMLLKFELKYNEHRPNAQFNRKKPWAHACVYRVDRRVNQTSVNTTKTVKQIVTSTMRCSKPTR